MIVSHARKFIFVKTRKTSVTSMEVSLSHVCGPEDIITPISFEDELVRLDMGATLPQNYGGRGEDRYRDMIRARKLKLLRTRRRGKCFNHMPAVAIREYVGCTTLEIGSTTVLVSVWARGYQSICNKSSHLLNLLPLKNREFIFPDQHVAQETSAMKAR